jgi:predicted N-acyltransferase
MRSHTGSNDYVIRVHSHPAAIDAGRWNALLERHADATPFMRHEYFAALHDSESAYEHTGWVPQFLTVERHGELHAACPLYLKHHSYGEYVFDWAWAEAYHRHGLRYYPKLLNTVPFTPVPGPRLLARDGAARELLLHAMVGQVQDAGLSSAHVLFLNDEDRSAAMRAGWMMRSTVQFHWANREPEPYADFADFLASLQRDKRKKIQQERRRVAESGVSFSVLQGEEIGTRDWDFFYRCYTLTYRAHGSTPYLTREFFRRMAHAMAPHWLLFVAWKGGRRVAASLIGVDRSRRVAFGRYWGAVEPIPFLHFEACYYQPLDWCIAQGMRRFEGGAQGEHKMARGLLPVQTWSAHWLAHSQFAAAVADYLEREGAGVAQYLDELNERRPFKDAAS